MKSTEKLVEELFDHPFYTMEQQNQIQDIHMMLRKVAEDLTRYAPDNQHTVHAIRLLNDTCSACSQAIVTQPAE